MERPAATNPSQESVTPRHFRDYFSIIFKRKWMILGLFLSVTIGTALYALMQPRIYESRVSLLVEPKGPNVMKGLEDVYDVHASLDYYKTQYELIQSYQILRDVVRRLNLRTHAEYSPKPPDLLHSWVGEMTAAVRTVIQTMTIQQAEQSSPSSEDETERQVVEAFRSRIKVAPVANSRIIQVVVNSIDPHLAAQAANTIAAAYISRSMEMKSGAAEEASKWIASRVDELRSKLEESERVRQEFINQHGLINVDDRKRLVNQKLGDLHNQLMQAETKRLEGESRLSQITAAMENPRQLESSAEALNSPQIQALRAQESSMAQKVAELGEKYGPKHPTMAQATTELRELRSRIQSQLQQIYATVKSEYDAAVVRERVIRNAVNQQKSEAFTTGKYEVQYGILEREVESNRQLYDMFLKRLKETDIAADIRASNIYVADPAIVSLVPVKPRRTMMVLLAALASIVGGIGLAFFAEYMSDTLKSPDDIAQHLPGLALLGYLPVMTESRKASHGNDLVMHEEPHSVFAEQIRSIRTNLMLSAADKPPSAILVTSPLPADGKSTFATNLAIAYAQLGRPTILIEGDLRNPRLQTPFGLTVERGLSHYLVGAIELHEILLPTAIPNLKVILCGAIPPNPAELLQSQHMAALFEYLRKSGAYIILDSPPILAIADSLILSRYTDGVILVLKATGTTRQMARQAVQILHDGNAHVLGLVLQRVKNQEWPAYYSHYGKYYRSTPQKPAKAPTHVS